MVLSMEEPWPGKGDLPWEYSRAPGLAAALGLPHRLGMSQRVLQPGHIGQPLRLPDHSPKHNAEQLGIFLSKEKLL